MNLHKSEIDALLIQYNIQVNSQRLLWEVDNNKVYGIIVDGVNAIKTWRQLYEIISVTQHYPVLLGSQEETNCYIENNFTNFAVQDNKALTVNEIINVGNLLNVEQWLTEVEAQRREEWGEFLLEEDERISYISQIDSVAVEEMVDFDECISPITNYTIIKDFFTKQPYKEVVIALVPTTASWEVPAFLKFGNWNSCPEPRAHVALMKHWYELYGAEVVGISNDVVEMQVKNPPKNMAECLHLAKEQYIYCYDIVDQGVQTLKNLAQVLLESKIWFFWWD